MEGSVCKINNFCIFTNRTRGILSKFRLSRLTFRKLVHSGLVAGFSKSSW